MIVSVRLRGGRTPFWDRGKFGVRPYSALWGVTSGTHRLETNGIVRPPVVACPRRRPSERRRLDLSFGHGRDTRPCSVGGGTGANADLGLPRRVLGAPASAGGLVHLAGGHGVGRADVHALRRPGRARAIEWAERNIDVELDKDGSGPHGERLYVLYAKLPRPFGGGDWFVQIAGWVPTRSGANLDRRHPLTSL